jgi:hypothetical protein
LNNFCHMESSAQWSQCMHRILSILNSASFSRVIFGPKWHKGSENIEGHFRRHVRRIEQSDPRLDSTWCKGTQNFTSLRRNVAAICDTWSRFVRSTVPNSQKGAGIHLRLVWLSTRIMAVFRVRVAGFEPHGDRQSTHETRALFHF